MPPLVSAKGIAVLLQGTRDLFSSLFFFWNWRGETVCVLWRVGRPSSTKYFFRDLITMNLIVITVVAKWYFDWSGKSLPEDTISVATEMGTTTRNRYVGICRHICIYTPTHTPPHPHTHTHTHTHTHPPPPPHTHTYIYTRLDFSFPSTLPRNCMQVGRLLSVSQMALKTMKMTRASIKHCWNAKTWD